MSQSQNVEIVTDSSFQSQVMQCSQLAIIDFWAEWCGPCRQLSPTIEQLANDYAGQAKIFKMNVDENPNTPSQFQIRGIPTVLFFKGGQLVDQIVGNQSKEAITQVIQKHLQ